MRTGYHQKCLDHKYNVSSLANLAAVDNTLLAHLRLPIKFEHPKGHFKFVITLRLYCSCSE